MTQIGGGNIYSGRLLKTVGGTAGADEWTLSAGKYFYNCVHGYGEIIMEITCDILNTGVYTLISPDHIDDDDTPGTRIVWLGVEPAGDTKIKVLQIT